MSWLFNNWEHVLDLLIQHLALSIPAVLIAVVIAVPIGRLAFKRPVLGSRCSAPRRCSTRFRHCLCS